MEIRIADASGKLVRTFDGPAKLGINRATWDFGRDPSGAAQRQPGPAASGRTAGPRLGPGTYTVTVKYRERRRRGRAGRARPGPQKHRRRLAGPGSRLRPRRELQNAAADAITRIERRPRATSRARAEQARRPAQGARAQGPGRSGEDQDPDKTLGKAARDLQKKLTDVREAAWCAPRTPRASSTTGTCSPGAPEHRRRSRLLLGPPQLHGSPT